MSTHDTRRKDVEWVVKSKDGNMTWEGAQLAVLMDIRDELKRLNNAIYCPNFQRIPQKLDAIRRNTAKKKRKVRS